ncbi:hypothetical protein, partial [Alkalibacillus haloalkaliphilus]|uniref:hypothetical protein n=1 Tax=Alkalibacillus haloalkaliphilus TaxID=94136 RepID=UPI00293647C3
SLPKIRLNTLYAFPILVSKGLRGLKSRLSIFGVREYNLALTESDLCSIIYQRSGTFIGARTLVISVQRNLSALANDLSAFRKIYQHSEKFISAQPKLSALTPCHSCK